MSSNIFFKNQNSYPTDIADYLVRETLFFGKNANMLINDRLVSFGPEVAPTYTNSNVKIKLDFKKYPFKEYYLPAYLINGKAIILDDYDNDREDIPIETFIFSKDIKEITRGSFAGYSNLKKITIPFVGLKAGVKKTDNEQYPFGAIFGSSSYLNGISTTQYYYQQYTLALATSSDRYYIPSSLKKVTVLGGNILHGAFYNCDTLDEIILPKDLTEINKHAFYGCTSLTHIDIPETVTTIGNEVFKNCRSLTEIVIPNGVTTIGSSVFNGCSKLKSITIPFTGGSMTDTESFNYIFGTIPSTLKNVTVTYNNNYYLNFSNSKNIEKVILNSNAKVIPGNCFINCSNLKEVQPLKTIASIGASAFKGCTSLEDIEILDYDLNDISRYLGEYAFSGCTNLKNVKIINSVSIERYAFSGCTNLKNVKVHCRGGTRPDGTDAFTRFCYRSFEGIGTSGSYATIIVPRGAYMFGEEVFYNSYVNVFFEDSKSYYESNDSWTWNRRWYINAKDCNYYWLEETQPSVSGNYWHYVDGVPTPW